MMTSRTRYECFWGFADKRIAKPVCNQISIIYLKGLFFTVVENQGKCLIFQKSAKLIKALDCDLQVDFFGKDGTF